MDHNTCPLLLERVIKLNPYLANLTKEFIDERDRLIKNKSLVPDKNKFYSKLKHELYRVYNKKSVQEFFDKVTIPLRIKNLSFITIVINGFPTSNFNNSELTKPFTLTQYYFNGSSVESFGELNKQHKCFTFFSALKKQWRDFKMNIKSIELHINRVHPDYFYPYDEGKFHFAIHSPNTLPVLSDGKDFWHLDNNSSYRLLYSRVETRLLGSGFDTNCFDYDLDHKFANYNMRSDCITSCYKSKIKISPLLFYGFPHLQRKELFVHDNYNKTFIWTQVNGYEIDEELKCFSKCPKDCKFIYFITNDMRQENTKIVVQDTSYTRIDIEHNRLPDIIVVHYPEITFIGFICNFGGLLGLWLGLNVLQLFNDVLKIIQNVIGKKCIFKFSPNLTFKFKNDKKLFTSSNVIKHFNLHKTKSFLNIKFH